ncbi:MAG: hypothetical protein H8M99_03775 [Gloeobacteraceae cyanobacterium ES-bin-144]|nr:hypothetical protein [Verrucomicrobiales bacterium]
MNHWTSRIYFCAACCVGGVASGQTIFWNSDANAVNRTSADQPMDAGFRFELGVFTGSFVPTSANKVDWAANWNPAKRIPYDVVEQRYGSDFTPDDNDSIFAIGKASYVWGFRGDAASGEWILFCKSTWLWPDANPPVPPGANAYEWFAKDATAIVGSINSSGSPFLMKSAAVSGVAPPATSFEQWQSDYLTGEPLNGPSDDPDKDGISNLLEFVYGSLPKTANAPASTPITLVSGKMQISIPRRIDRTANLVVEVSENLTNWFSGPSYTTTITNDVSALVVRDLTTLDAVHPKRFMRLRASLP